MLHRIQILVWSCMVVFPWSRMPSHIHNLQTPCNSLHSQIFLIIACSSSGTWIPSISCHMRRLCIWSFSILRRLHSLSMDDRMSLCIDSPTNHTFRIIGVHCQFLTGSPLAQVVEGPSSVPEITLHHPRHEVSENHSGSVRSWGISQGPRHAAAS